MTQKPIQIFWADNEPHCLTDQGRIYWLKRTKNPNGSIHTAWVNGILGEVNMPKLPDIIEDRLPQGKKL